MSDWEERRKAEEAGRYGGPPPSGAYLDDWQRGKSISDWNNSELARQQAQSTPSYSAGDSTGSWSPSAGGSGVDTSAATSSGMGCLLLLALAALGLYLWPVLYPFSTLVSLASGAGAYLLLHNVLPSTPGFPLNSNAAVAASVVALIVLWMTSRFDHRLARRPAYRIVRHIVRLVIIGLLVSIKLQGIDMLDPSFPRGWRPLGDPVEAGVALAVVVVTHFVMWTDNKIRDTWHGMLEAIRLR